MRKEYSDLPASQKMNYIKDMVVGICLTLIPIIVMLSGVLIYLDNIIDIYEDYVLKNSTELDEQQKPEIRNVYIRITMTLTLFAIFGWIFIGSHLSRCVSTKFGWYTDIDLESAQRRVDEIKSKLEKIK